VPSRRGPGVRDGLKTGDHVRPHDEANNGHDFRLIALDGEQATILSLTDGGEREVPLSDLLTVRRFGDPTDVGLTPLGATSRSEERPYHAVIDGENFHVLQLLVFVYEHQVDCIYIDPPYNTGAKDWTYNNRFVDLNDSYGHSKWLSTMEKGLRLAKRLLKPDGVLIITVDEHEVHHLGVLLEMLLPTRVDSW
jgi:adenine-specific DNA-methyltransferase